MSALERVPASTDANKLAEIIERDGAVVLEDLIDSSVVAEINDQLEPYVQRRQPGFRDHDFDDTFYGSNTIRIQGLAMKAPSFVPNILLNPTLLGIADELLLPNCGDYWMSQAETIFIGPGNPAQELHRDDLNWSCASQLGIDLQVSVLTALGDYDAEVGATMVIPRSHRLPLAQPIDSTLAEPVQLEPGSALVYLGTTVHGGGHNATTDRWRKALYTSYLVGWLTPEEAVPMSIPREHAEQLPDRAKELLGFANIRQPADADGARAALQLWQLDAEDFEAAGAGFIHR